MNRKDEEEKLRGINNLRSGVSKNRGNGVKEDRRGQRGQHEQMLYKAVTSHNPEDRLSLCPVDFGKVLGKSQNAS